MERNSFDAPLSIRDIRFRATKRGIRVSVCLAAFNGSNFLRDQIDSILNQLCQRDELIIVDDCSTDGTVELIRQIADPRITLYENTTNMGVVRTFERAIEAASGDVIFLSDQDDLWKDGKVETVAELLDPDLVMAVVTDANVIDAQGREVFSSFFEFRGSGPGYCRNFVKNSYLGCTMAFTKEARACVLPFPRNLSMHDEWIGIVCDLLGEVKFEKKKLISYRRHGQNVSGMLRRGWLEVIAKRILWLKLLIVDVPQRWARRRIYRRVAKGKRGHELGVRS